MVILKDIKITAKTDISSDLLVLGFFKKTSINTMIKYLSSNDQAKVLKAFSIDGTNSDEGQNIFVYGSDKFSRIMIYNLGDKDKFSNDKMRSHSSKIYSIVNAKKIKTMAIDSKSFGLSNDGKSQSMIEGLILGSYRFEDHKSKKSEKKYLKSILLVKLIKKLRTKHKLLVKVFVLLEI